MRQQEKQVAWRTVLGKYRYVLLVIAAGLVLLLWPTASKAAEGGEEAETAAPAAEAAQGLEEELAEILSRVEGVGQVQVLLTVDRGTETVLASDTTLSYSGATAAPDDYTRSTETVVLSGSDGGVVVTQEVWPRYRGALVVCEGGGDPAVQLSVIQAVGALTGLGSDKISVVKWQA